MPNVEIADAWKLSSGLRDDMVISIHGAYFAPDADYQGGRQLLLFLLGTDENNEPVELRMSVGSDWQTTDGGNTIVHPTKKVQRINGSTIYGHWISHVQEIPELVKELQYRDSERGPTNAKVWEGLIIHCQEREIKFGRNIDPQQRLMPTEYFGLIDDSSPASVPPVSPAPVAAPPAPAAAVSDPAILIAQARAAAVQTPAPSASPLYDSMVALARSSPDFPTFLAAALANPEVLVDDELAIQCADEALLFTSARA